MKSSVKSFMATISTILLVAVSCNKEIADTTDPKLEMHTCEMKLIGSLGNFDGPETRAEANTAAWTDGSIIYLRMSSPLGATTGEAVYNASKDVWTISYYGSLYEGVSNSCTALYLEDKVSYENNIFTFDEGTAIFEDLDGSYIYDGGDLIVTANLRPKTGRIRFTGVAGSVLKVYDITHYTTYDISTDNYTTSAAPFKLTVGEDGYTPYIYGYFTDTDEPNVKLWIDAKEAYTRYCSTDIFNAGQSGKMTIPTEDSHSGWTEGLYFSIYGEKFKMVAVEGGKFVMGDASSTSEYYIPHDVTLTGFCIAETELTQKLYNKLYEQYSTELTPSTMTWNSITGLLEKFNTLTYAGFNIPTEAQWEFAAKGGSESKGYTYSGSNNIDDVAWHKDNSEEKVHEVKTKLPNELGIYDMSGNVREFTLDYFNAYKENSVTDPLSTTDGKRGHVTRGGLYRSTSDECTNYVRLANYYTGAGGTYYDTQNCGVRLSLNWN